jgi:hypothetical protein
MYGFSPHIGNKQRVSAHSFSDEKTELGECLIADALIEPSLDWKRASAC